MQPLRLHAALVKKETTYGVDATPAAGTDGLRGIEPLWSKVQPSFAFPGDRPDAASGRLRRLPPVPRKGRIVAVEIGWEARGSGAAYSATVLPEAIPLFEACGYSAAIDTTPGSEKVTLTLADSGHASATIYGYAGGWLFRLVGARGKVVWPVDVGALGLIRFQMQALLLTDPAAAALPQVTYDSPLPPPAVGMTLGITPSGGALWNPLKIVSSEFDQGAEIQRLDGAEASDGVAEFAISGFDQRFSFQALAGDQADYDAYLHAKDAKQTTIAQQLGSAQYNRIKLDTTEAYPLMPEHPDQQEFAGWGLGYELADHTLTFD